MSTEKKNGYSRPEWWAGVECTVNRVGDKFRDQLESSGHYDHPEDIALFAQLGVKAIRQPVLWETHSKDHSRWAWTAKQLDALRSHNINPIVGLLHHGSGPAETNLLDDQFGKKLSAHAAEVARKFPWVTHYTPVNEPLTTARFSGLYGYWFPHHSNARSFLMMLLNQLEGVVRSMKEIRQVNPEAKLVQTEDLCKVHSTPALRYQADFENLRRWLTYDILCGKLDKRHGLWKYVIDTGVTESKLSFFLDNPCPPDILGLNYYVTSQRFLDENISQYPHVAPGGNGRDTYVDVEAVRAHTAIPLDQLLQEVWERYALPMAITEAHLGCTREEQMRWIAMVWKSCCKAIANGVDVKAITAWALLGAYDWNSLLTKETRHYESGVFVAKQRRSTGVASLVAKLAKGQPHDHPLLDSAGWWEHPSTGPVIIEKNVRPLMIVGKTGTLGTAFTKICHQRGIAHVTLSRQELDITDDVKIQQAIDKHKPWAIVNASGFVNVDLAETMTTKCYLANTTGPWLLAKSCREQGIRLMTFSSDMVFCGTKGSPYTELDQAKPLNHYGKSKANFEAAIAVFDPTVLVIRTSAFFGPWDQYNFVYLIMQELKNKKSCRVVNDITISPTYVPDLVHASLDLLIDEQEGLWHVSNDGALSWADFALEIAGRAGLSRKDVIGVSQNEMQWKARRPKYSVLQTTKGLDLPSVDDALNRYFKDYSRS
jgi:dTDP-4-dehydrorhamnose reductase